MADSYEMMQLLKEHLVELFELCGVQDNHVQASVASPTASGKWMKNQGRINRWYADLAHLDEQVQQAIEKMKERNLDDWNRKENEKHLDQLEKELEKERAGKEKIQRMLNQEAAHAQNIQDQLNQKNDLVHELEQSLAEEKELNAQCQKERLASIQDLIRLRDKLMLRKDWLEDQAPEDVNAKKVVESQLRDLARCLNNMGVEILEADGDFDNRSQTVMETCVTDSKELLGKIAETLRPGYRFQDEILRPQEVVLYTTA